MDAYLEALRLLPEAYRDRGHAFRRRPVEEIRLRLGRAPCLLIDGQELPFSDAALQEDDLRCVLERATGASVHTALAAMQDGYISCKGLRIGLCGEVSPMPGDQIAFRSFGSLAIRIPQERKGICGEWMENAYRFGFRSTLIAAPPGAGKTTVLREMIRRLSNEGYRVGVVDERNELSATERGQARFDLGEHSDILIHMPKAEGAMMLLRAMNPQIIAMDEITREEDARAIFELAGSGVGILASAHGRSRDELRKRALYRGILDTGVFHYMLLIDCQKGKRTYQIVELKQ